MIQCSVSRVLLSFQTMVIEDNEHVQYIYIICRPWSALVGKFRPLPEPIRLQDLVHLARSRAEKKIKMKMTPT